MTGPEHYRTAEEHIDHALSVVDGGEDERVHLHYAAVHAQLALAAATALGSDQYAKDLHGWITYASATATEEVFG